jgi:hypothetical protein
MIEINLEVIATIQVRDNNVRRRGLLHKMSIKFTTFIRKALEKVFYFFA